MSDFHLTPIPASELEEGQSFFARYSINGLRRYEEDRIDHTTEAGAVGVGGFLYHDGDTVWIPACPAQRKWEALRETFRATLNQFYSGESVLDVMDAIDGQ